MLGGGRALLRCFFGCRFDALFLKQADEGSVSAMRLGRLVRFWSYFVQRVATPVGVYG